MVKYLTSFSTDILDYRARNLSFKMGIEIRGAIKNNYLVELFGF